MPGGDTADVGGIYVTTITTPTPGKYWLLAEPVGGQEDPGARERRRATEEHGAVGRRPGDPVEDADARVDRRRPD